MRLLAQQLEAIHPDLFAGVPRARFRSAVDSAAARADELEENELLVELDAHRRAAGYRQRAHRHLPRRPAAPPRPPLLSAPPVRIRRRDVCRRREGSDGLVGARITAVGGIPYADVAKRVRPLVPHDNASNLQGYLPHFLLTAEVLDGLGIAKVGPTEFTFTQRGKSRTVTLSPVTVPAYISAFRDPHYGHYPSILPRRKPTPMYLSRSASTIGSERLREGRAVFFGFNVVSEPGGLGNRLTKLAKGPKVKRVIVDLRLNGGGEQPDVRQLLGALTDSSVNRKGRLFVLIGRATFSAAGELRRRRRPLDEGDVRRRADRRRRRDLRRHRFGAAPEERDQRAHRGEVLELRQGAGDKRLAVNPDRRVNVTVADFLAGRDPVLAAALR